MTVTGKKIEIEADSSNMDEKEPESVDLTSKVDPPVQDETKIEEKEKDTDVVRLLTKKFVCAHLKVSIFCLPI